jgi:hypothetical protein
MGLTRDGRRILVLWVGAVMAGGLLAGVLGLALVPILDDQVRLHATSADASNWGYLAVRATFVLVSAVAIAGPSAFVLGRRLVGIEVPWIVASAVGGLVAASIPLSSWLEKETGFLMQEPARPSLVVVPLLVGVVAGCVTGAAQAIVLNPYVRGAAWWIAASILARGTANVVISLVNWQVAGGGIRMTTPTDIYVEELVNVAVGWLIVGIVSGLVLMRLLGELNPERTAAVT